MLRNAPLTLVAPLVAFAVFLVSPAAAQVVPPRADNFPLDISGIAPEANGPLYPPTANERAAASVGTVVFARPVETKPGVVSVNELKHPLSKEGERRLKDADADLRAGRRQEGLRKLQVTLEDPSTRGHARAMLGTEYLRQGQLQSALENLTEAARLLPGSAAVRSNLGNTLCHLGFLEQGEDELRQALALNPGLTGTRYLLGIILLDRPADRKEAYEHLSFASRSIPGAHLGLAILYTHDGDAAKANREIELYRPGAQNVDSVKEWLAGVAAMRPLN